MATNCNSYTCLVLVTLLVSGSEDCCSRLLRNSGSYPNGRTNDAQAGGGGDVKARPRPCRETIKKWWESEFLLANQLGFEHLPQTPGEIGGQRPVKARCQMRKQLK